jgi:assimilatory nitrate reductase catalytic subunit
MQVASECMAIRDPRETTMEQVATHCPYCALQCGMQVSRSSTELAIAGDADFPVNRGALCIKGWTAHEPLTNPDRLREPLVRDATGALVPTSWTDALDRVANALQQTRDDYGKDAVGVFGGGSLTNEKAYLLGKFARVALGTSNIDYNGRFCMSSAAAASNLAFGLDRGLPFPVDDIAHADAILLVGSNTAETMPPLMQYFQAQIAAGGRLIVVDPRRSPTAQAATTYLQLIPGSDAALANGILHVLIRDGMIDEPYIGERSINFDKVRGVAATYWPERVERITGVPASQIVATARTLGTVKRALVLTARGAEQQAQGVANTLSYINVALALGLVGRHGSGYGCLTGQGNGQGGREHGQKADQLPGYRRLDDPAARHHVASVWGVPEEQLPQPGRSAYELLDTLGEPEGVRALLVMGSNPVVSAPNAIHIDRRLRALDTLVVADTFLSESAQLADIVLPSAQWAEEAGTMTNLEGRVIRRRRVMPPPPGVRTDVEILCELAARLGWADKFNFTEPRQIFDELCLASAGGPADYAGISYEKIDANQGIFWPCPTPDSPGTPRLFTERFPTPDGKARFSPVQHASPAEAPDSDYTLYLTTGRILGQYQSGTITRRVARLTTLAPEPLVEIHPSTARQLELTDGASARLTTRRGEARFTVKVTADIRPDTVFVPFHWGGKQSINRLTNPALDPVSRMPEFKVCAVRVEPAAVPVPHIHSASESDAAGIDLSVGFARK